jgi:DUF2075 family protein
MYFKKIKEFCDSDWRTVYSEIDHSVDNSSREGLQKGAWDEEIKLLKDCFNDESCADHIKNGYIAFEYTIPRLGKRPDVILLIQGIVFVLEFKIGETSASKSQKNQALGYAEALKHYHFRSWNRVIIPILIATKSKAKKLSLTLENKISNLIVCNADNLIDTINQIIVHCKEKGLTSSKNGWETVWINGQYNPNPSIIESTLKHYNSHEVIDIKSSEADTETITDTTDYVVSMIKKTQKKKEKAIFFVTGVPGAGKTLVGLEIVAKTHKEYKSVFLSGNRPLVEVLSTALTKDTESQEKCAKKIDHERFSGELYKPTSMVQLIHGYRKTTVDKIKAISSDGELILNENTKPEVEHVVIFDEAQRAWTKEKLQSPDRSGTQTILRNNKNFPYSEPGFLIWSMNQHKEWSVIVCLVGGGQEINTGEAGIVEWICSLKKFPNWKVYMPKELKDKEYGGDELKKAYDELTNEKEENQILHLSVSRRSIRSEKVSDFIKQLLDGNINEAKNLYHSFKEDYPIAITRDLEKAKQWIRNNQIMKDEDSPYQRAGALMSSKGFRLRPLGYENKTVGVYDKVAKWFLGDVTDTESSDFLEVALSEFFVQGLELDWTLVLWDADFRAIIDSHEVFQGWEYYGGFNGKKWEKNNSQQDYQLNAYRVLLTRARRGMIIFIPSGDKNDPSRSPELYDSTYKYLKSLGIVEV